MKVKDIVEALEQFAPLSIQEGWDNSGLCIGAPEDEVHGVLVGFDCTPELACASARPKTRSMASSSASTARRNSSTRPWRRAATWSSPIIR